MKSKGNAKLIGNREFADPISIYMEAIKEFFLTVNSVTSGDFLNSLREDVFPIYEKSHAGVPYDNTCELFLLSSPLCQAIHDWAAKFNLHYDLNETDSLFPSIIAQIAINQIKRWHYPQAFESIKEGDRGFGIVCTTPDFKANYNPSSKEPRKEAEKRICSELRCYLNKMDSRFENLARSPHKNLIRTPRKQLTEKGQIRDFEILVKYQVMGIERPVLANEYGLSVDAIRDAIESASNMIGLKLRPGRTGRPPKAPRKGGGK